MSVVKFQVWPELIRKSKEGGLDVIETYVFWNVHEPSPGNVPSFDSLTVMFPWPFVFCLILTWIFRCFALWVCSTILKEDMIW